VWRNRRILFWIVAGWVVDRNRENVRTDGNGRAVVDGRRRLLGYRHDKWRTRQRFEIRDQWMGAHELVDIKVHGHWQRGRAGWDIEHLAAKHLSPVTRFAFQRDPRGALQIIELAPAAAASFENYRRPGYRNGDSAAPDRAAAGILRNAQQNRAGIDLRGAAGFVETEDRVRAETRDGEIGEG